MEFGFCDCKVKLVDTFTGCLVFKTENRFSKSSTASCMLSRMGFSPLLCQNFVVVVVVFIQLHKYTTCITNFYLQSQ